MQNIKINNQQLITVIFILSCLVGYIFFPANGDFQYKASFFVFLAVLPFLYNKYFLKKENLFKRVVIGNWKKNIQYLVMGLIAALLIMAVIFKLTDLGLHYFLPKKVKIDFGSFLIYELGGISFMVAVYEIFFRGFVMNFFSGLKKWSILIQFLFFVAMILMLRGAPYWFYIVYLVFTPFAGWIAYKSESILYSFFGQWMFIILIDATFIAIVVNK
jgi:hypothetical protein